MLGALPPEPLAFGADTHVSHILQCEFFLSASVHTHKSTKRPYVLRKCTRLSGKIMLQFVCQRLRKL